MAIKFLNTVQVDTDVLYVNAATGDVGIGTTSPAGNLHVVGDADNSGRIYLSDKDDGEGGGDALLLIKTGVNSYIYNRDSGDLRLGTNNQFSYVTIKPSGFVGIGTTTPDALLEISGNAGADPGPITNPTTFRITDSGNAATGFGDIVNPWGKIEFYSEDASSSGPSVQAQIASVYNTIYSNSSDLNFYTRANPAVPLSSRMTIDGSGNVGIGTTSPTSKLQVASTGSGPVAKFDNTQTTGGTGLEVNGGNGTSFALSVGQYNGLERFRVQGNGNVGIGTSSPATQLEIFNNNDEPTTLRLSTSSTDGDNVAAIISFENGSDIGGVQGRIENIIDSGEDGSTSFKFYTNNTSTPAMTLFNSGSMTIAGAATATNFILSSDKTLKNKIKNIKAKHVDVKWKNFELISEPGIKRSGIIAQELEAKHPEFIRTDKDGLKSVAYIDLLITKIAELEARIKKLEK